MMLEHQSPVKKYIFGLVLLVLIGGVFVWISSFAPATETPGGSVPDGWLTANQGVITFKYPESLQTQFIQTVDWPPQAILESGEYSCLAAGDVAARAGRTEEHMVGGHPYCVTVESEGAAGSIYLQFAYAFPKNNRHVVLTFTTRQPQCANYDEPNKSACVSEEQAFDLDGLVDQMAQTLTVQ